MAKFAILCREGQLATALPAAVNAQFLTNPFSTHLEIWRFHVQPSQSTHQRADQPYVARFLPPWFRNYGKRVVKTPKFYFYDVALVNLLTRQPDCASALAGPMGGPLLEGWVVTEAVKAFMSLGRKPELYFWRSHDGLEVDLLIVIDGKLHPVEIKLTATPSAGHVEPINRFIAAAGDVASLQGMIVCRTNTERALPNGHLAMAIIPRLAAQTIRGGCLIYRRWLG